MRVACNLEQVGPRLLAPDADRATERILAAMNQISDQGALETLTRGLEAVVPRLTGAATTRAAEQLASGLARARVGAAIWGLVRGLRAIAQRLPASDAGRYVERAADRLVESLLHAHESDELRWLAGALGELEPLLAPGDSEAILARLAAARTPIDMLRRARALAALGPRMAAPEAERVAERVVDQLLEAIAAAADPDDLRRLAEAIKAVMPLLAGPAAARTVGRLIEIMATTGDGPALKDLVDAMAVVPGGIDAATAINLLKFPMCVGPPRDSILSFLEARTGKTFGGDVWRLVEQASDLGISPGDLVTGPTPGGANPR